MSCLFIGTRSPFRPSEGRKLNRHAAIIGENELERGVSTLRDMRSGEERTVTVADGAKELLRAVSG